VAPGDVPEPVDFDIMSYLGIYKRDVGHFVVAMIHDLRLAKFA
jgi:hypothetical protein